MHRIAIAALGLAFTFAVAATTSAQTRFDVLLDWYVNPDHAPLVVALDKGFFREAGLDVRLIAPSDPNDPPKLVAAGKAPVAVGYQPQLQIQVARGLPLVRIATLVATPLNSLVVLDESPIKTIADLKGKRIGYAVAGLEEVTVGTMLARHGLSLKDVTLIGVNFALTPALLTGQVDAVIGAYRNFELNQIAIAGRKGRAFHVEEEGVPPYDELILVAQRGRLAELPLRPFVDALERGVHYLINHPDDSWRLFIKRYTNLDDELNRRAWRDTLPRFALRPAALDRARYIRFAEFLKERGLIDTVPPLDEHAIELPRRH